jgi:hypothetical protein
MKIYKFEKEQSKERKWKDKEFLIMLNKMFLPTIIMPKRDPKQSKKEGISLQSKKRSIKVIIIQLMLKVKSLLRINPEMSHQKDNNQRKNKVFQNTNKLIKKIQRKKFKI